MSWKVVIWTQGVVFAVPDAPPAAENIVSAAQNIVSADQNITSAAQNIVSAAQNITSAAGNIVSADQNIPSAAESIVLAGLTPTRAAAETTGRGRGKAARGPGEDTVLEWMDRTRPADPAPAEADNGGPPPMSEPDAGKTPTEEELQQLPRWACVAFAARCACRVLPLFEVGWPDAPREHVSALESIITLSVLAAADAAYTDFDPDFVANDARAIAQDAATSTADDNAYYAASTAADAAVIVAIPDAIYAGAHAALAAQAAISVQSGTFDNNYEYDYAAAAVIRRDYDLLLAASKELNWTDDTPVPPEFFGPMWPEGTPEGWPEPEHDENATPPVLKFEIAIPAGMNAAESRAFDAKIVELLAAMSAADVAMGGNGLRMLDECSNEPFPIEDETRLPVRGIDEFVATGGCP